MIRSEVESVEAEGLDPKRQERIAVRQRLWAAALAAALALLMAAPALAGVTFTPAS
jgi:hypothetical protein